MIIIIFATKYGNEIFTISRQLICIYDEQEIKTCVKITTPDTCIYTIHTNSSYTYRVVTYTWCGENGIDFTILRK